MKTTTITKQHKRITFQAHHHPFLPLKYPTNPLLRPLVLPRPVRLEYGASRSYSWDLGARRARIRGGARMTAMPRRRPVAKPPRWEELSRPGRRPRKKQIRTWIRRMKRFRFGWTVVCQL